VIDHNDVYLFCIYLKNKRTDLNDKLCSIYSPCTNKVRLNETDVSYDLVSERQIMVKRMECGKRRTKRKKKGEQVPIIS
jgi:hypothetical protein